MNYSSTSKFILQNEHELQFVARAKFNEQKVQREVNVLKAEIRQKLG
jgi:hypothetical protein